MVARWFSAGYACYTKGCGFEPHGLRFFFWGLLLYTLSVYG